MGIRTLLILSLIAFFIQVGYSVYFSNSIVDQNTNYKILSQNHTLEQKKNLRLQIEYATLNSINRIESSSSAVTLVPIKSSLILNEP